MIVVIVVVIEVMLVLPIMIVYYNSNIKKIIAFDIDMFPEYSSLKRQSQ